MSKNTNTITLKTAQEWAKRWRKEEGTYNEHHKLKAMLIPLIDITQLLEQDVDAIRAYIGVDDDNKERFMLVGTKYDKENDTYYDMLPSGSEYEGDIYDFTKPCPECCDKTSSLNIIP